METLKQVFKYFEKKRTNEEYIRAYEQNIDLISNEKFRNNSKNLEQIIQIKIYKYGNALASEGEYKKLDKLLLDIEKDLRRIPNSRHHKILSEGNTFMKAKSLNYQKKYLKSNKILKKLIERNVTNSESYEKWYKYNLGGISNRILLAIVIIWFIWIAMSYVFDFKNRFFDIAGVLLIILGSILQWIYKSYYLK